MSSTASISSMARDSVENHHQEQSHLRFRWVIRIGLIIAVLLGLTLFTDWLFHPQRFPIKQIEIQGQLSKVDSAEISDAVSRTLEGNYFSLNLAQLEREVTTIPWVFDASIRRKWPSTVVAEVVEIQPVANWQGSKWLNFTGDLVSRPQIVEPGYTEDLPILSGPDGDSHLVWQMFQQWSGKLASTGLNLDKLSLDSTGLWTFELSLGALSLNQIESAADQGTLVTTMVVDKENADDKIIRFIDALNQELIVQFPNMQSIDLRYPNGFAIMWRDQDSQEQMLTDAGSPSTSTSN